MRKQLFILLMVVGVLLPLQAKAQDAFEEEYHKNIKVYQLKPILERNRVEIIPFGAFCVNPNMMNHIGYGGFLGFHFNEAIFAGVQYTKFYSFPSFTKDQVKDLYSLFPERSELDYNVTARFAWTPFFAKGNFLGMLTYWDAFIFGGGGITRTKLSDFAGTGEFGVGGRFFITKGIALTFEFSDMLYAESFRDGTSVLHNVMVRGGLSVFLPYGFSYRSEK
mgnify:FL=1